MFSAWTESMLKALSLLLTRLAVTPLSLANGLPLNFHVIFKGKSPLLTEHDMETISPELIGSSPKSKCQIWGKTAKHYLFTSREQRD